MVADSIPQLTLQKITHLTGAKAKGSGTPGCLGASALLLGAPNSSPVQLCSETGKIKLLANIMFVIKRLCDIIPKYKRNHSQITRPA